MRKLITWIFYSYAGPARGAYYSKAFRCDGGVHRWFVYVRDGRLLDALSQHRVILDRERAGSEASQAAALIDNSNKTTRTSGGPRG